MNTVLLIICSTLVSCKRKPYEYHSRLFPGITKIERSHAMQMQPFVFGTRLFKYILKSHRAQHKHIVKLNR